MNFLVDTHLLLWASTDRRKLPLTAYKLMADERNILWVSAASIWEVAIKHSLKRPDFDIDPGPLRAGLVQMGYQELSIESRHIMCLVGMPYHHTDPFDRLLLAQSISDGLVLLTSDQDLSRYDGPVRYVG
jgi:PIN domain nuclease of toxin-antitoxin system